MNGALALAENDTVRMFPTLSLPVPVDKDKLAETKKPPSRYNPSKAKYNKGAFNTYDSGHDKELPGLLRSLPNG